MRFLRSGNFGLGAMRVLSNAWNKKINEAGILDQAESEKLILTGPVEGTISALPHSRDCKGPGNTPASRAMTRARRRWRQKVNNAESFPRCKPLPRSLVVTTGDEAPAKRGLHIARECSKHFRPFSTFAGCSWRSNLGMEADLEHHLQHSMTWSPSGAISSGATTPTPS